MRMVQL